MVQRKSADPAEVERRLARAMPEPRCEIDYQNAWQLLVGTILSAQSTDRTVNKVTPALFRRYPTPQDLARAPLEDIEDMVRPTGFYRRKAKAIRATAEMIVNEFGGEVPQTLEELVRLPGVARKTANLVLGTAFGIPSGMVVDTHAGRVARRLGLTAETDPVKVERDLCAAFPKSSWVAMSHRLVLHGRYVCLARKPRCACCPLAEICPSAEEPGEGPWTRRADEEGRIVAARGEV